jgi:hypothetical protein
MSDERKLNTAQKRRIGKTTQPSAQLRTPASPAFLLPAQKFIFFARIPLDTLGRTESHLSDSKQTIGVALTRHSYEATPRQLSHADSPGARPSSFYALHLGQNALDRSSGSPPLPLRLPHPLVCKGGSSPWSLSGALPIIAPHPPQTEVASGGNAS